MTPEELQTTLRALSGPKFAEFRQKIGRPDHSIEKLVETFIAERKWEDNWARALGLMTEEDKEMQATLSAADSARRSAEAAERSTEAAERSTEAAERSAKWAGWSVVVSVISLATSIVAAAAAVMALNR